MNSLIKNICDYGGRNRAHGERLRAESKICAGNYAPSVVGPLALRAT